jgi:hypothetical protein
MERGTNPPVVNNIVERVKKHGLTVSQTELSAKRREELKLPAFRIDCLDELDKLFKP